MQLVEKQHKATLLGDNLSISQFNIAMTGKMFKILSDGIYSDKILAIVRELSTNAYDSHVENNNVDTPFLVHLPIYNKPIFYIRDFGTGMSHEKISKLYTTYGMSDKDESNNFVGCLGLGSKTPFCYNTHTFTVENYYNGVHYNYSCYLNNDGRPCIVKLSEQPTTEQNGVKITVPVKKEDITSWYSRARIVYRYFKNKPEIIGQTITLDSPNYVHQGKTWFLRKEYGNANIIMGNVAYPISALKHIKLNPYADILSEPLDIYANIGDVNIEVSREGLSYDDRTVNYLCYICNEIKKDIKTYVENEIASSKNLYEAYCKYNDMSHQKIFNFIHKIPVKYKNKEIQKDRYSSYVRFDCRSLDLQSISSRTRSRTTRPTSAIVPSNTIQFFINDVKTGWVVRPQTYCIDNHKSEGIIVSPDKVKEVCDLIGCDDSYFIKISTLPSTPRNITIKRNKTINIMRFCPHISAKTRAWENTPNYNFKQGGFYVIFDKFNIIENTRIIEPHTFNYILSLFNKLTDAKDEIFGIKKRYVNDISKEGPWTNYFEYMKNTIRNKLKDSTVRNNYIHYKVAESFKSWLSDNLGTKSSFYNKLLEYYHLKLNKECQHAYKIYQNIVSDKNNRASQQLEKICRSLNIDMFSINIDTELRVLIKTYDDMVAKFPVLQLLMPNITQNNLDDSFIRYLNG